jgi:hypothetical protein
MNAKGYSIRFPAPMVDDALSTIEDGVMPRNKCGPFTA